MGFRRGVFRLLSFGELGAISGNVMDYLSEIRTAIKQLHGCESTHLETVPVKEVFKGQTVWEGEVEVFALTGHPKARKCYAWGYPYPVEGPKRQIVAVLEIPPVESPQTAVRAAIVAQAKK